MSDKDKTRIDGRTMKEIRLIAQENVTKLTDKQWEAWSKSSTRRSQGGMIKGFSPISRPQRFKGVF
jgi:hypothetical protein|tara:strand:+ start:2569 stop:2766 length:198 start_codon:yes stop_codon:yes gene_type:complete